MSTTEIKNEIKTNYPAMGQGELMELRDTFGIGTIELRKILDDLPEENFKHGYIRSNEESETIAYAGSKEAVKEAIEKHEKESKKKVESSLDEVNQIINRMERLQTEVEETSLMSGEADLNEIERFGNSAIDFLFKYGKKATGIETEKLNQNMKREKDLVVSEM